jgi:hypothetical protein
MRKIAAMAQARPLTAYLPQDPALTPGTPRSYQGEGIPDPVIEERIDAVAYTVLSGTATTVCTIVMNTGYSVSGACACADPEAFDPALGKQCAYAEAFRKLKVLFGFLATECRYLYQANTTHLREVACCGCDLVHTLDYRIHEGRVQLRASRHVRATAAKRLWRRRWAAQAAPAPTPHTPPT